MPPGNKVLGALLILVTLLWIKTLREREDAREGSSGGRISETGDGIPMAGSDSSEDGDQMLDLESPYEKVLKFLEELASIDQFSARVKPRKVLKSLAQRAGPLHSQLLRSGGAAMPDIQEKALEMEMADEGKGGVYNNDIMNFVLGTTATAGMLPMKIDHKERKDMIRHITKSAAFEQGHLKQQGRRDSAASEMASLPENGGGGGTMANGGHQGGSIERMDSQISIASSGGDRSSGKATDPPISTAKLAEWGIDYSSDHIIKAMRHYGQSFQIDILQLDIASRGRPLVITTVYLLGKLNLLDDLQVDTGKLVAYLEQVERGYYRENPYHNNIHAADVTQRLVALLRVTGAYPSAVSPLQMLAAVISAAIHDYEHPGTNNSYHVAMNNILARTYNDQHVLENHSLAMGLELLMEEPHNFLANLPRKDQMDFRSYMVDMVLATDIASHWDLLSAFQSKVKRNSSAQNLETSDRQQQILILKTALKCADLGHCALPLKQHIDWVARLENEFFSQGDNEKREELPVSPLMDRERPGPASGSNQIGFFDFVVLPLFRAWTETFPACREFLECAHINYIHWRADAAQDPGFMEKTPTFVVDVPDPVLAKLDEEAKRAAMAEEEDLATSELASGARVGAGGMIGGPSFRSKSVLGGGPGGGGGRASVERNSRRSVQMNRTAKNLETSAPSSLGQRFIHTFVRKPAKSSEGNRVAPFTMDGGGFSNSFVGRLRGGSNASSARGSVASLGGLKEEEDAAPSYSVSEVPMGGRGRDVENPRPPPSAEDSPYTATDRLRMRSFDDGAMAPSRSPDRPTGTLAEEGGGGGGGGGGKVRLPELPPVKDFGSGPPAIPGAPIGNGDKTSPRDP